MKKCFALLLTLLMAFSLCACGETGEAEVTQEELMAKAAEMTDEIWKEAAENSAYANSLVGNTYSFVGTVAGIEKDHVIMDVKTDNSFMEGFLQLHIYLPAEQMLNLEKNLQLAMVGKIAELVDAEVILGGDKVDGSAFVLKQAYIVQDRFVFEGKLLGENESYGGWNVVIGDDNYAHIVDFADDVDTSQFQYAQKIHFSARFNGKCLDAALID